MKGKNLSESSWLSGLARSFSVPTKIAELSVNGKRVAWAQGNDEVALSDTIYYALKYIAPNSNVFPPDDSVQIDVRIASAGLQNFLDI